MEIQPIGPQGGIDQFKVELGESRPGQSFLDALKESIQEVNGIQKVADQSIQDLVMGKGQDLHQTMIALEKASVSFQLMMSVRNKIVTAYEEISRMQV